MQGTADVDDRDLDANRERYGRESLEKLPATKELLPPKPLRRMFELVLHAHLRARAPGARLRLARRRREPRARAVRRRTWRRSARGTTRSRTSELAPADGGGPAWDDRLDELGDALPARRCSRWSRRTASRSRCACRSAWTGPRAAIRIGGAPVGVPLQPGLACVTAHDHAPDFTWQRNFQVRGDLVEEDGDWARRAAPAGRRLRAAAAVGHRALSRRTPRKILRFRKIAKRAKCGRGRRGDSPAGAHRASRGAPGSAVRSSSDTRLGGARSLRSTRLRRAHRLRSSGIAVAVDRSRDALLGVAELRRGEPTRGERRRPTAGFGRRRARSSSARSASRFGLGVHPDGP